MIRKLNAGDHPQVSAYIKEEASFNLFIIGDLENYGYDRDFQEVWGEYDAQGALRAVLLRYYHNYLPYAKGDFDVQGFSELIWNNPAFESMSGKKNVVERFGETMDFGRKKELYFAELVDAYGIDPNLPKEAAEKAEIKDIEVIFVLKRQIEQFQINAVTEASFRRALVDGTGRTYVVKVNGEVVSCASTAAENTKSAMIVGVCTHPTHRNQGYASLCVRMLCEELTREGKTLCLFYDNPVAGAIYKRIGFNEIGMWNMFQKKGGITA